jgi:hypothetical protein
VADRTRRRIGEDRGELLRKDAAAVAPTAPHARPRDTSANAAVDRKRSGPERFWDRKRVRGALVVGAVLSIAAHFAIMWSSFDRAPDFELRDVDGELAIPVDIVTEDTPPPASPSNPTNPESAHPTSTSNPGDTAAGGPRDAGVIRDGGADGGAGDAGRHDASAESIDGGKNRGDGSDNASNDAHVTITLTGDASTGASDAEAADASLMAMNGSHDAIDSLNSGVHAAEQAIVLVVNMAPIRQSPIASRIGPLITHIPQWDTFMAGANIDPVRDIDWIQVNGPSLRNTDKDEILVRYSAPDSVVDQAVDMIKSASNGTPFDAGVRNVKATLATADRAPRVFFRPQSHALVAVPPNFANTAATYYAHHALVAKAPFVSSEMEAVHLTMRHPNTAIPQVPEEISKLSLAVAHRGDDSAEIALDGECGDPSRALSAMAKIKDLYTALLGSRKGALANAMTNGILEKIEITTVGDHVRVDMIATPTQIEAVLELVSLQLGVDLPPLRQDGGAR